MKLDKLDVIFSEYIRKRAIKRVGGCERCLRPKADIQKDNGKMFPAWKQLQCSHFHGRSSKSVRWDEDNAAGLCGACHIRFGGHGEEHRQHFIEILGQEGFDLLNARESKPGKPDKELLWIYYKEQVARLTELP